MYEVANTLVDHKTTGCSHPFGPQGCTVPSNQVWSFEPIADEGSDVPGYSITEAHWDKDKKFEARLMVHYSRMGDIEHTMESFLKEYRDACNGIRSQNKQHLERIFKKAYQEIYRGDALDKEENPDFEHDQTIKILFAAEGKL